MRLRRLRFHTVDGRGHAGNGTQIRAQTHSSVSISRYPVSRAHRQRELIWGANRSTMSAKAHKDEIRAATMLTHQVAARDRDDTRNITYRKRRRCFITYTLTSRLHRHLSRLRRGQALSPLLRRRLTLPRLFRCVGFDCWSILSSLRLYRPPTAATALETAYWSLSILRTPSRTIYFFTNLPARQRSRYYVTTNNEDPDSRSGGTIHRHAGCRCNCRRPPASDHGENGADGVRCKIWISKYQAIGAGRASFESETSRSRYHPKRGTTYRHTA